MTLIQWCHRYHSTGRCETDETPRCSFPFLTSKLRCLIIISRLVGTMVRRTAWSGDWSYGRGHVAARPMPTPMIPLGDVGQAYGPT